MLPLSLSRNICRRVGNTFISLRFEISQNAIAESLDGSLNGHIELAVTTRKSAQCSMVCCNRDSELIRESQDCRILGYYLDTVIRLQKSKDTVTKQIRKVKIDLPPVIPILGARIHRKILYGSPPIC